MKSRAALPRKHRKQGGFALLIVIFLVTLLLIGTMSIGLRVLTEGRREKEQEMIWRGKQYTRGIKLYYRKFGRFPTSLDDLTKPSNGNIRFMRQAYKDPMNKEDGSWRLIYVGPTGQLIGSLNPAVSNAQMAGGLGQPTVPGVGATQTGFGSPPGAAGGGFLGIGTSTAGGFGATGPGATGTSTFGLGPTGTGATGPGATAAGTTSTGCPAPGSAPIDNGNGTGTQTGTGTGNGAATGNGTGAGSGAGTGVGTATEAGAANGTGAVAATNCQSVPTGDTPAIMGGSIIGIGSKVNQTSVMVFEKAQNYHLFEFVWNPSQDMGIISSAPPTPIGTPAGAPGFGQNPTGAQPNPMPPLSNPPTPNPNPQQPQN
jgi:hypothetical protein